MTDFPFSVVAPDRIVFSGDVSQVSLRSEGGDIGFLAGHVPFIGAVEICVCEITPAEGGPCLLAIHGGFVEVAPDGAVTLLASVVETAEEIDVARARAAQERASTGADEDQDPASAGARARAEVRLSVAGAG